jgi:signal transduction histidine kinase/CheY-like chemotaxis protein
MGPDVSASGRVRSAETDPDEPAPSEAVGTLVVRASDGSIVAASDGVLALTDATRDDLLAAGLEDLLAAPDMRRWNEQMRAIHDGTRPEINLWVDLRRAWDTTRPVAIVGVAVDTGDDELVCLSLQDQQRAHTAEERAAHAERMATIGRFVAEVAHDFNTVLGVLEGQLGLLEDDVRGVGSAGGRIEMLQRATRRGAGLVSDLLAFARAEPGEASATDVNATIRGLSRLLERMAGPRVHVDTEVESEAQSVGLAAHQVEQVIVTLVANAAEAMPEGGRVTLRTRSARVGTGSAGTSPHVAPGDYVVLSVHDTGDGLTEAEATRIFEPFYTTKPDGTGMGLPAAQALIARSGGGIAVQTAPGKGSCFEVYLPVRADDTDATVPRTKLAAGAATIVVFEPDPDLGQAIVETLRTAGHEVMHTPTWGAAVQAVTAAAPDVLVMHTDGGVTGQRLRDICRGSTTRVLCVASGVPAASLPCTRMTGASLLTMPFSNQDLIRGVDELLADP